MIYLKIAHLPEYSDHCPILFRQRFSLPSKTSIGKRKNVDMCETKKIKVDSNILNLFREAQATPIFKQ